MPPRRNVVGSDAARTPAMAVPSTTEPPQVLKNRPKGSKLRQQKLPAWQPILTAYTAIPTIFIIGFLFIPLGVFLLMAADGVHEFRAEYTNCSSAKCIVTIDLEEDFLGNVYFYYGLDNYFQNHRRYVKSRSDRQLSGADLNDTSNCAPYEYVGNQKILPCGAIANSMFNDTFRLTRNGIEVKLTYQDVVWSIDKDVKFRNPEGATNLCDAFKGFAKPPNWQRSLCELDPLHPDNNGLQNVDFIVWMRTAALPSFRKLYRLLDRNEAGYTEGLPKGRYELNIDNNYPVSMFNGKKWFIISTTSWAGGNNRFLGISYLVIGSVCVLLGAVFTFIHHKFGHSFAEMADVTSPTLH